jgi:hypothetical protein
MLFFRKGIVQENRNVAVGRDAGIKNSFVLIALLGLCGSMYMLWLTKWGAEVCCDSVAYLDAARNLLEGNGFVSQGKLMTHYPPGYPILLAITSLVSQTEVLVSARILCVLLYGVNVFLFGFAAYLCTKRNLAAAICAVCFFVFSVATVSVHFAAMSEAPFITLMFLGFILLNRHMQKPDMRLLLLASLVTGFALVTRYVGVTLLPPAILALVFISERPIRQRLINAAVFTGVACLPLAAWITRNLMLGKTAASRPITFHPIGLRHARTFILTTYDFFLSLTVRGRFGLLYLGVVTVVFLIALVFLHKKKYLAANLKSGVLFLTAICLAFFVVYGCFLVFSISFIHAHTPLDQRILLPALLALALACIALAWHVSQAVDKKLVWQVFLCFAALNISINSAACLPFASSLHRDGRGYNSRAWQQSETLAFVRNLPGDMKIYSNGPDVIYFHLKMKTTLIPSKLILMTQGDDPQFAENFSLMCEECKNGKAAVVYFGEMTWRHYLPSKEELEADGRLPVLARLGDGTIFRAVPR